MKQPMLAALLALIWAGFALGGPLQKSQVPADTKWVLHLDLEAALNSQVGRYLAKELVDRRLKRPLADLQTQHGLTVDWHKIHSVTVFGTQFDGRPDEDVVLLVQGALDLPGLLDKVMDDLGATGPLTRRKEGGRNRYSLNDEIHGAAGPGGVFVLSKSSTRLEETLAVLDGKGSNLSSSKVFSRLPAAPDGFIFLGLAEGFSSASAVPHAKMLKHADGGQLVAGEKAGQVFASLSLSTRDAEAASQIQQVLQGLLALGAMNQTDNKDLQRLIQATKVTTNDTMVSVNVELPASNIIARVTHELRKRNDGPDAATPPGRGNSP